MRDGRFVRQLTFVTLLVALSWSVIACRPPAQPEGQEGDTGAPQATGEETTLTQRDWALTVTDLEQVKGRWVFVQIVGPAGSRQWQGANTVAVCRTPRPGCGNEVSWSWLPPEIPGATLRIVPKEGQPDCFGEVVLPPPNPTATSATVDPECPPGPWLYTITCEAPNSDECPPKPLDPRIEIEDD